MGKLLKIHNSLNFRMIFWVGLILLIGFAAWSYLHIKYGKQKAIENLVTGADRLGNTIRLGTQYAMKLNSRDDINQIIKNIGRQKDIENIRVYNKHGQIKFSNKAREVGQITNIKAEACDICHMTEPPLEYLGLAGRTRIFESPRGEPLLGIISPIYNEPGCSTNSCHVHPKGKKVLGALDVVVSLKELDKGFIIYEWGSIAFGLVIFLGTSSIISFIIIRFVNRPIKKLVSATGYIGGGEYGNDVEADRDDEIGQLALAINEMRKQIGEKQEELNKQKEEYRNLFEHAPCYITVQDRDLKLLTFNREFAEKFKPEPGDYCYKAYKGRSERCEICPVVRTFEDGKPHTSEETGINKDGTRSFWMVRTSPLKNTKGEVISAMEMSLDVTQMKFLENEIKKSEEKYRTIFNTMPNPIFVLDPKTLDILDCNDSATTVYGIEKDKIFEISFRDFFEESERAQYTNEIKTFRNLNKVKQARIDGRTIFVNIRSSSFEYMEREVLLVTASDITARLMAEQQLIQASKMATLGEMATGVAHELNQPLSVIKTASNFFLKKIQNKEAIKEEIMEELVSEMDNHVDRASKIINHMRDFGRHSVVKKEEVQVNETLNRALEIFSQQLKLRQMEVVDDIEEGLPPIMADSNRLEQVFINILINARDAIEEKGEHSVQRIGDKKIFIKTYSRDAMVFIEVKDTGTGIPGSIRDRIFDPFFTTKKAGMGTGLGLSISYSIVHDYGGTIKVETREGEGSTFIIKFPIPIIENDGTENPFS